MMTLIMLRQLSYPSFFLSFQEPLLFRSYRRSCSSLESFVVQTFFLPWRYCRQLMTFSVSCPAKKVSSVESFLSPSVVLRRLISG